MAKHRELHNTNSISKNWWDEELSNALTALRHTPKESYTARSNSFKRLVKHKKKTCWEKFPKNKETDTHGALQE